MLRSILGRTLNEIQTLVNADPRCWLDAVSEWRSLHGNEMKQENASPEYLSPLKRKLEEETNSQNKRQKREQILETVPPECQAEKICDIPEVHKGSLAESRTSLEETPEANREKSVERNGGLGFTFRVSCRCSGAIARAFTSQEVGRIIGIALMKQFGWKADLRNPEIEIFVHLNDIYSLVGIPVFRLPLASREYIKTAGLRSTVAWAMASLAEISTGAVVLDPMCGLGTILLEAAKEWPNVCYLGTDISDSQLQGAYDNIEAAGLVDKIELIKASVTALPLPSESVDVVIADVPFGNKYQITKDIKLLPDVLREIERVLRARGTVVLLLKQDLHKHVDGCVESDVSLKSTSNSTCEAAVEKDPDPQETNGSIRSIFSSAHGAEREHVNNKMTRFGSLVPIESYGVSLGKMDAFIYKYRKIIDTAVQ
uniref:U6 snRNA (guanine-N(2))-methyltransferase THUMPD2 n=1 Tax=Sphenodon punctatus TaxID=8508 RepID=A0A8D0GP81_SPHPU